MTKERNNMIHAQLKELLFTFVRAGLDPGFVPATPLSCSAAMWQQLFELASAQGVTAILFDGIESLARHGMTELPPRGLKLQWALNVDRIEKLYERQRQAIARMSRALAPHAIRLMILKGHGLSLLYPRPEHRPCGDVDIWTFGRQEESDSVFHSEFGAAIDKDKHHHTVFFVDGVMVENHFDFLNIHSHRSNRVIERELQRFAQEPAHEVEVDGCAIYLPSANFNALFLLRHAAAHFAAREIGLRHVLDWALFLKHDSQNVDWERIFAIARRMNMHRFLDCMNAIAMERFGIDASCAPTSARDGALERRVLDDILSPEFSEEEPKNCGFVRRIAYRTRRWWCNRWKHRMVYSEGLFTTFIVQIYSHLLKPKSLG